MRAATTPTATPSGGAVVVGLEGGYVRSRHRQEEHHFEVIAGKVIADGPQHRFAFARNGQPASPEAFAQALAAAGVRADTPASVLCDGDARSTQILPMRRLVTWSGRNGACGGHDKSCTQIHATLDVSRTRTNDGRWQFVPASRSSHLPS